MELSIKTEEDFGLSKSWSSDNLNDFPIDDVEATNCPRSDFNIKVWNVVSAFNVGCRLDLKDLARKAQNIVYSSSQQTITMRIRRPTATAFIRPSGKVVCAGTKSKEEAHQASRRFARILQKLGYNCKFRNFRISNFLATCRLPFNVLVAEFAKKYKNKVSFEPEISAGAVYKMNSLNVSLRIHSSGSINLTAKRTESLHIAVKHIFPILYEFRKPRLPKSIHEVLHTINPFQREEYEESDDSD